MGIFGQMCQKLVHKLLFLGVLDFADIPNVPSNFPTQENDPSNFIHDEMKN